MIETGLIYCRNCGTVRVLGIRLLASCGACNRGDKAEMVDLKAATRGDGSVVFYVSEVEVPPIKTKGAH